MESMAAITAFLNSILNDVVYVRQPEGYVDPKHPDCFSPDNAFRRRQTQSGCLGSTYPSGCLT
jgi:hypothetical protein